MDTQSCDLLLHGEGDDNLDQNLNLTGVILMSKELDLKKMPLQYIVKALDTFQMPSLALKYREDGLTFVGKSFHLKRIISPFLRYFYKSSHMQSSCN